MKHGFWITRDPQGDRAYAIWLNEPTLSGTGDEWVPFEATGGRQPSVIVTESFAVRLLGHKLEPGQIEFRKLPRKQPVAVLTAAG
jgi:hypothetical protein